MSFFEVPPPRPEPSEPRPEPPAWSGPPDGVLPAFSQQRAVLARTDSVFLAADRFLVYPNGFEFTLMLLYRRAVDGHGDLPWERGPGRIGGELPDDLMRFGLLFADGKRWSNLADRPSYGDEHVDGPVVLEQSGGGNGTLWRMRFWVWPLPAPGKLTFVVSWPSEDVEERQIEVDADEFHRLAEQAEQIWT